MGSYLGSTEETSADFCLEVSVLLSVCAFRHCLSGRPSRVEADLQRPKCFFIGANFERSSDDFICRLRQVNVFLSDPLGFQSKSLLGR